MLLSVDNVFVVLESASSEATEAASEGWGTETTAEAAVAKAAGAEATTELVLLLNWLRIILDDGARWHIETGRSHDAFVLVIRASVTTSLD